MNPLHNTKCLFKKKTHCLQNTELTWFNYLKKSVYSLNKTAYLQYVHFKICNTGLRVVLDNCADSD